ncbi:MAG: apolipoprotein N-acyltransferase [Candidatus Zipacnadales bacterium]
MRYPNSALPVLPVMSQVGQFLLKSLRCVLLFTPPWHVILATTTGALLALACPPVDAGWLAWIALMPLLVAVRTLRPGAALVVGWIAGTVFFACLMHYIRQFGLLPWFALAIFQGSFLALFGYIAAMMWRIPCAWLRVPALAAAWTAAELLRGHCGALQFTFGSLGYSQHRTLCMLQPASLIGHYGLGHAIALFSAAVVEAIPRLQRDLRPATGGPLVVYGVLLLITVLWGLIRINRLTADNSGTVLNVLAVQGDISAPKASAALVNEATQVYIQHTLNEGQSAQVVVWPETAIPARLNLYPSAYDWIQSVPKRLGCTLLLGAAESSPSGRTYNTLWAFNKRGELTALYRKRRLVIFGEYLPWRDKLGFLMNRYPIRAFDYSPGMEDVLIPLDGVTAAPMICFESIFPDIARRLIRQGAEILIVITSDTWAGDAKDELHQHAQCSVLRAVETGRWLVRAAGTGVTFIVDPAGRVVSAAPIFELSTAQATVRARMNWTPYVVWGDWPLTLVVCLLLLGGLADIYAAQARSEVGA